MSQPNSREAVDNKQNRPQWLLRYAVVAAVAAAVGAVAPSWLSGPALAQDEAAESAEEAAPEVADDGPAPELVAGDDEAAPKSRKGGKADRGGKGGDARSGKAKSRGGEGAGEDDSASRGGGSAADVDPEKVIASAGEVKLTAGELKTILEDLPMQVQAQLAMQPAQRRALAEQIVQVRVLAGEARRRNLEQRPWTQLQFEQVLAQALQASFQDNAEDDKAYFEEHKKDFDKLKVRHILVGTQGSQDPENPKEPRTDEEAKAKADEIRQRLEDGEDFTDLAREESDDPGVAQNDGEYTFGPADSFVPEFKEASYGLEEQEISQPVKSQYGYHVIQLLDRIPQTFDQSRAGIAAKRIEAMAKELGADKVEVDEEFFKDSDEGGWTPEGEDDAAPPSRKGKKGKGAKESPKKSGKKKAEPVEEPAEEPLDEPAD